MTRLLGNDKAVLVALVINREEWDDIIDTFDGRYEKLLSIEECD